MQEPRPNTRRIVPDTRRRDLILAGVAGVGMLLFILYAIFYFSREVQASSMSEGVIVSKAFVPLPETQITFGHDGLNRRELAGEYSFQVRVPLEKDREYKVLVDPRIYESRKAGDHVFFRKAP